MLSHSNFLAPAIALDSTAIHLCIHGWRMLDHIRYVYQGMICGISVSTTWLRAWRAVMRVGRWVQG